MMYISIDDLKADAIDRFIEESVKDNPLAIDKIELKAIAIVKAYLAARYDVAIIFGSPKIDNEILKQIIVTICLYKIFSRNAARKISFKERYDEAMSTLKDINSGKIILELPEATDSSGNPLPGDMWGNLKNTNNYI